MNPETPLLETRQLCRFFRSGTPREVRAVDSISMSILPRSFAALVGPSGSGKTSLLSLLGLLDRPTSGSLSDAGRETSNCSDHELARLRRRRGFVFQDFGLLPKLDVLDNICYPLIPRGLDRKRRTAIATHWLDRLGLASQVQSRPDELSGGECQRVALARALASDPDILLADEPTSNLDDETKRSIRDVLCEVHRAGKTFVIATHDSDLLSLATHVFYLRDGKLVSTSP